MSDSILKIDSEIEVWRRHPAYPDYDVSTKGIVRNWKPRNGSTEAPTKPRYLKYATNERIGGTAHQRVSICGSGKVRQKFVHILVLETFVGPRPFPEYDCCHNDGNPANNNLDNLRWDTKKSNAADRKKHKPDSYAKGERSRSSLTNEDVFHAWELINAGERDSDIAVILGTKKQNIRSIRSGKTWKHLDVGKKKPSNYIISEDVVWSILSLFKFSGLKPRQIAELLKCGKHVVYNILYKRTWLSISDRFDKEHSL